MTLGLLIGLMYLLFVVVTAAADVLCYRIYARSWPNTKLKLHICTIELFTILAIMPLLLREGSEALTTILIILILLIIRPTALSLLFHWQNVEKSFLRSVRAVGLILVTPGLGIWFAGEMVHFQRVESTEQKLTRTVEILSRIETALTSYRIHIGQFPLESEGLSVLLEKPRGNTSWRGPYLDVSQCCDDAFGKKLLYHSNGDAFCLRSSSRVAQSFSEQGNSELSVGSYCEQ